MQAEMVTLILLNLTGIMEKADESPPRGGRRRRAGVPYALPLDLGHATLWSLRIEDDEEALKWDAIEKLLTYDCLGKGLLKESLGVAYEDVHDLGPEERINLIERLAKSGEKFLLKLRNRLDRSLGR